ncbi:MAG TPA: CBS domain-containing protein [Bacteriovoracaceae bacterium]|nr:CBS domain-containing protein [Bacteriovoracaceae bacterium]
MQVSEIMHKGVSTVQINDSIQNVAALMKSEDIGSVPVYDNGRPVGFVTDRDIVISCVAAGHPVDHPVTHAMSRDVYSVKATADITEASRMMKDKQVSRLLVVDSKQRPVGMLTLQDLTKFNDEDLSGDVITEIKQ